MSGGIDNDFGLHVNHHNFVGHDLRGELGSGGPRIHVSNVNGHIESPRRRWPRIEPGKRLGLNDKDEDDSEI